MYIFIPPEMHKSAPLYTISFVARKFGPKGVKDLEKISTALYVTKDLQGSGCGERARRITELKPHIPYNEAEGAVRFVDEMIAEAERVIEGMREAGACAESSAGMPVMCCYRFIGQPFIETQMQVG